MDVEGVGGVAARGDSEAAAELAGDEDEAVRDETPKVREGEDDVVMVAMVVVVEKEDADVGLFAVLMIDMSETERVNGVADEEEE